MTKHATINQEWLDSPQFSVLKYRNPETIATEQVMDDFISFLEYEHEDVSEDAISDIKALIHEYLEYDASKVKQGEQELLNQWIKATKGE